ncbi:MAG: hypothetical protein JW803_03210 [Endomicrobiales bacterium]|nr:hypothetical protein [Endomicrobiales bacterium]
MKILGLSLQHDAGAALIDNGVVAYAVNEERLNREKMFWGIPELSIEDILGKYGPDDIDAVVFSNLATGNPIITFEDVWRDPYSRVLQFFPESRLSRWLLSGAGGVELSRFAVKHLLPKGKKFLEMTKILKKKRIARKPVFVEHHDAHAVSAYATSGYQECLAVTLDAFGDGYCSKIFRCKNGSMKEIHHIPFYHSPGYYYSYVTHLCGFRAGRHEGKITGLAAHGDPEKTIGVFREELEYDPRRFSFVNKGGYLWPEIWRLEKKLKGFSREDISAGMQQHLEDIVSSYVADAVKRTGMGRVALAGGVFANVKMNQRIRELPGVEGVWVHPHMGDGGLAVGAALHLACLKGEMRYDTPMKDVYLGPCYSADAIEAELKRQGCRYSYFEDIEKETAKRLAKGKVAARFSGRMEYGPRALGNRSILYQATEPSVNDWLNKRLKRTEFMPFAPVVLHEDAGKYFEGYGGSSSHASEFMTITYNATQLCRKEAPAVVHVDGTARPQVVKNGVNAPYEKILREYKKMTGLSVLINTSFNMHEEPIVCTPSDAIRAYKLGHLDCLSIENYLVEQ